MPDDIQKSSQLPGYFTPAEIMARFGWTRQQLNATAKRESWSRYQVGRAYLYSALDVEEFAMARLRTELLKQLGWFRRGLIRHDEYDTECPVCGAFAVMQPGKSVQEEIELNLTETRPWICRNGHTGG